MGNSFCFCDKNDPNINSYLIKGDINLIENNQENKESNKNKLIQNLNDKKNPESNTYSNSNHHNENENENENENQNENENENEIDDNVEENEEENNEENENNSNKEDKAEESENNEENNNNNNNDTYNNNYNNNNNLEQNKTTEIQKLQNINDFKEKMKSYVTFISESEFEEAIPSIIKDIEKNMDELNQSHEKIQSLLNSINPSKNITCPPILFNDNKMIYMGMWNINGTKEGYGTLIDSKGNKYQGGFLNDLFQGYGRIISIEGDCYEGEWKKRGD